MTGRFIAKEQSFEPLSEALRALGLDRVHVRSGTFEPAQLDVEIIVCDLDGQMVIVGDEVLTTFVTIKRNEEQGPAKTGSEAE